MKILQSLFGKKQKPEPISIRDTLFGDMPLAHWPTQGEASDSLPWGVFVAAREHLAAGRQREAIACWQSILAQPGLEARCYLQAWHFLRQQDVLPAPASGKQILGVVVEVAMPNGLDLLAAYPDYSARYYNYSGAGVVWEHPDASLDTAIAQLLTAAQQVVRQIGPWDQARPAAPTNGSARLCFLTPSGLHFGQGPMTALAQDPLAAQVLQSASALMQALIAKANVS